MIAQIKELLPCRVGENNYEDDDPAYAEWVDASQMLCLNKDRVRAQTILTALCDGVWQLEPSATAQAKKASIRAAQHARKSATIKEGCEFPKVQGESDSMVPT